RMLAIDGVAWVLQVVKVPDNLVQTDLLNLRHDSSSAGSSAATSWSPVYESLMPGASLPRLPKVRAGPDPGSHRTLDPRGFRHLQNPGTEQVHHGVVSLLPVHQSSGASVQHR